MNKLNYFLLGAAGLALASCSQEEIVNNNNGGEVTATFNVSLPLTFETRAGDGAAATNLYVGVYDADNNNSYLYTAEGDFGSGPAAKVSVNLTPGKNYFFTFFAGNPEAVSLSDNSAVYYLNEATGALTVNYDEMTSEGNLADLYDCFYEKLSMTNVGNSEVSANVTLKRPVAQINWSTNDFEDYATIFGNNGEYIQSKLTADVFTSMNLITGEVAGLDNGYEFPPFAIPSDETFAIEGYDYVAYQYVLAPSAVDYINLSLLISNAGNPQASSYQTVTVSVNDAVLQANYQTNIYGSLLSGEVTNVSKDEWVSGYNPDLHWDGETVTYPQVTDASTPVVIGKASDLAGLANMVNGTAEDGSPANDFSGYTISLAADFDMGGKEFPQIGSTTRSGGGTTSNSKSFRGTFDGQNHTISNIVINGTSTADDATGFIGNLDGSNATLKDITFDNIQITASQNEQAGVIGLVTGGATVSNVKVTSGTIEAKEAPGGIVGRMMVSGTISSCENSATVKSVTTNAGGIVGAAYRTAEGETCTVENCKNFGAVSGTSQGIGGIAGISSAVISGCENNGTITGGTTSTGGIVGQQNDAGEVTNCINNGEVIGGSGYGSGGIVGWVRYQSGSGYPVQNIVKVSGCTNNANISGTLGVGGIVGVWYTCGICSNNTNNAKSIKASNQFVAGIIGTSQWTEAGPTTSVEGNTEMLYVEYNYSSTPQSAMSGGCMADIIYINTQGNVTAENNSTDDPSIVDTPFTAPD